MLVVTVLGVAVVGVVAVPAHRGGRDLLTAKGEGVRSARASRPRSPRARTHSARRRLPTALATGTPVPTRPAAARALAAMDGRSTVWTTRR